MRGQYSASLPYRRVLADVAGPQPTTNGSLDCYFGKYSAMVLRGRTQAAYFLKRGLSGAMPPAVQEYWSRGCRRARVLYSVFACWPLWLLAHRKKSQSPLWKNRFRPSLPTPASISDDLRRADQGNLIRHAEFAFRSASNQCPATRFGWFVLGAHLPDGSEAMLKPAVVSISQDRSIC
jgi:hypothetical protein